MNAGQNPTEDRLLKSLEAHGEEWVRSRFLTGEWGPPDCIAYARVKEWLAAKDSVRRDAREAHSDSIARAALRNSMWANIIAVIAIVLSVTIAIIQIFKS